MEKGNELKKVKSAKQGFMSTAKVASMRLYYGLVNKYCTGKIKKIEILSPDEEIIVLGRSYMALLEAAGTEDDSKVKNRSCIGLSPPQNRDHKASGNHLMVPTASDGGNGEDKVQDLQSSSLNASLVLKKTTSDKQFDKKDILSAPNEELEAALSCLACFTYRSNWSEPIPGSHLFSDAGWGCMIRVGQMAFFNCLIRDQMLSCEGFLEDRLNLLLILFNDHLSGEVAPFSIKNIVPLAFEKFNIPMGNWFRSTSIMMALDQLNRKYKPSHVSHIKMVTMLDSTLLMSRLFEAFTEQSSKDLDEVQMMQELRKPWLQKRLILNLTTMLGIDKPQVEYQKFLNFLLAMPYSVGILGGSDNKAYYIFGYNKLKKVYYYLDPHCVQAAVPIKNHSPDTYFKKEFFEISYEQLNPSLTFVFYFSNSEELFDFWHIMKANQAESFYSVMEKEFDIDYEDVIVML